MEADHVVRLLALLGLLEGQAILSSSMSMDDFTKNMEKCLPPQVLRYVIADVFACSSVFSLEEGMIWRFGNYDANFRS